MKLAQVPNDHQRLSAAAPPTGWLHRVLIRYGVAIRWGSVVLILIALALLMRALPSERLVQWAQEWTDSLGSWGPLVIGVFYILAALLFVPGSLLGLLIGALYGPVQGTIIVSLASTTTAALAFLIARYVARDAVSRRIQQSPKLAAIDQAIGEQGWKIVALLRLSPALSFNLQNYLYGVTAIRFWPYTLASWIAMLPGTFLYVYLGSLGRTAAAETQTSAAQWTARVIGLIATLAVTLYIARLARHAIANRTHIEQAEQGEAEQPLEDQTSTAGDGEVATGWPWTTSLAAALAIALLGLAIWVSV